MRSVVTEVGIFSTGFGLVLMALAIAVYCMLETSERLLGMPRGLVIASGFALLGIVCIVPGMLLLARRSKGLVWACVVCGSIPAIAYVALNVSAGISTRNILGTAFFAAVPIMLATRGLKAIEEIGTQAIQSHNDQ
jgi:4-amino-4-deoxy-L-arabinose transferase-like glycosyltransferase